MEKLRLAVFSMLDNLISVEDAAILDYFAGSGAFGFEALSRRAGAAVFVEKSPELCEFIASVSRELKCESRVRVLRLSHLPAFPTPFELIFCDPPYELWSNQILEEIVNSGASAAGTLLICEMAAKTELNPPETLSLELLKDKSYGDSRVRIFRCR
jgi:16S rRNA (guanine966-N2)-methyltransferase